MIEVPAAAVKLDAWGTAADLFRRGYLGGEWVGLLESE
jgi:hypothetical protein